MVEKTLLEKSAYALSSAYVSERKMVDAIEKVREIEEFKKIPYANLQSMWLAIDAYLEMNT